ncbi:MAG: acyl carrier protein [Steroidobacteraceae bacterium]|jgi:acyl carrier protein
MNSLQSDLQDVFRRVFDDDELTITDSMSAADVDGWDSMANINLIIAIEKRFEVKFAAAEIAALVRRGQNVGNMIEILRAKTER